MTARGPDPSLVHARREALVVMTLWLVALAWTIGYCQLNAYGRTLDSLTYVWGFPDWVFYGVIAPWLACTVFTIAFCQLYMIDDDWGVEGDSEAPAERAETRESADRG